MTSPLAWAEGFQAKKGLQLTLSLFWSGATEAEV